MHPFVCQTAHTQLLLAYRADLLNAKNSNTFLSLTCLLQQDSRWSSSNPRSVVYLINHTAHFNTRRNTLSAARVDECTTSRLTVTTGCSLLENLSCRLLLRSRRDTTDFLPSTGRRHLYQPSFPLAAVSLITVSKSYGTLIVNRKFNNYFKYPYRIK